jgi:RHS repeat-associated protein
MTVTPQPGNETIGLQCTYDAWNRLVSASDSTTTVSYRYDGQDRRTERIVGGVAEHYYYSGQQVVETRRQGNLQPDQQYVWSLLYVDTPILRDTYSSGVVVSSDRLYYLTDANQNVTAVTNSSGAVQERYDYDAYGKVTIYSGDWSQVRSVSAVGNTRLFAGQDLDPTTGLYYARARWYSVSTGGFISRDPLGFNAGQMNLYVYCGDGPANRTDHSGLCSNGDWLQAYSNWFNSTFGNGWSNALGDALYQGLVGSGLMSNETWANATANELGLATAAAAIPLGIGLFAGGEALLGVGTVGEMLYGGAEVAAIGGDAALTSTEIASAEATTIGGGEALTSAEIASAGYDAGLATTEIASAEGLAGAEAAGAEAAGAEGEAAQGAGEGSKALDQLESIEKAQQRVREGTDEGRRIIDSIEKSSQRLNNQLRGPYDPAEWE